MQPSVFVGNICHNYRLGFQVYTDLFAACTYGRNLDQLLRVVKFVVSPPLKKKKKVFVWEVG